MFGDLLAAALAGRVPVSADEVSALERHWALVARWNRVLNLTSVRTVEEAVKRHYCESLFLASHLPPGALTIADVGSGAGFPGYPVSVLRPDLQVTLIEGHQRKAVFLREASRERKNVRVLSCRAEQVTEMFDWVTIRAVELPSMLPVISRLAGHVAALVGEGFGGGEGWRWQEPVKLPWGDRRFLWLGARFT
jgi:16S rRNA (guanine527-N7)-methyltransferase